MVLYSCCIPNQRKTKCFEWSLADSELWKLLSSPSPQKQRKKDLWKLLSSWRLHNGVKVVRVFRRLKSVMQLASWIVVQERRFQMQFGMIWETRAMLSVSPMFQNQRTSEKHIIHCIYFHILNLSEMHYIYCFFIFVIWNSQTEHNIIWIVFWRIPWSKCRNSVNPIYFS